MVTITAVLLSSMDVDTPVALLCGYTFLLGAGVGLVMQNLVLAVQNAFPTSKVGTATSAGGSSRPASVGQPGPPAPFPRLPRAHA